VGKNKGEFKNEYGNKDDEAIEDEFKLNRAHIFFPSLKF